MTRQQKVHSKLVAGCACLALLCASSVFAQQAVQQRQRTNEDQQQQQDTARPGQDQAELPKVLQKLDLSSAQQTQIKQALQQQDQKLSQTWRQFQTKHAQAIELEAAWAAAVRGALTEQNQQKFDQQRMQQREMTRNANPQADEDSRTPAGRRAERQQRRQENAADPADRSADERQENQADDANNDDANPARNQDQARAAANRPQRDGNREARGFIVITTSSPERFLTGLQQPTEEQQECAKICREYEQKMTALWSDLHQLHHDLVKIEADRIQTIEQQLTEEQLTKLQEHRQQPQDQAAGTSTSPRSR